MHPVQAVSTGDAQHGGDDVVSRHAGGQEQITCPHSQIQSGMGRIRRNGAR